MKRTKASKPALAGFGYLVLGVYLFNWVVFKGFTMINDDDDLDKAEEKLSPFLNLIAWLQKFFIIILLVGVAVGLMVKTYNSIFGHFPWQ